MVMSRTPALACILYTRRHSTKHFPLTPFPYYMQVCPEASVCQPRVLLDHFEGIYFCCSYWCCRCTCIYLHFPIACIIILLTQICQSPLLWVMVISSLQSAFHFQYSTLFLGPTSRLVGTRVMYIPVDCVCFPFQYL